MPFGGAERVAPTGIPVELARIMVSPMPFGGAERVADEEDEEEDESEEGHQCLSAERSEWPCDHHHHIIIIPVTNAFRRSGASGHSEIDRIQSWEHESPMPFGGAERVAAAKAPGLSLSGFVTNAFRRSGASGRIVESEVPDNFLSPMPFGGAERVAHPQGRHKP